MYTKIGALSILASGGLGLMLLLAMTSNRGISTDLIGFGIAALLLTQSIHGLLLLELLRD